MTKNRIIEVAVVVVVVKVVVAVVALVVYVFVVEVVEGIIFFSQTYEFFFFQTCNNS